MHWFDIGAQALAYPLLYGGATFVADVVHYALHTMARTRSTVLARIGALHEVHHRFLGPDLLIHPEYRKRNLFFHRVPEYVTLVLATSVGFLFLPAHAVFGVLAFETILAVVGTLRGGLDSNHMNLPRIRSSSAGLLVDPMYHALHHVFPDNYMGSATRLFDVLFAKGCQIEGRRFAITGASGAFGRPLARLIEEAGGRVTPIKYGRDYDYGDYERLDALISDADVLVLCHGSKVQNAMQANCDSFVAIIERFRRVSRDRQLPVEVWALGSEIEAHPAWGNPDLQIYLRSKRAFAKHARRYFHDDEIVYRHIVPSAYTSPMGKGLISGATAAAIAMFFIRRGFRYVPVTYTGLAILNSLRFLWPSGRSPGAALPRA
ncbi:MAG: hypothetical protein ABSC94_18290 [Polyangiaceae bacterium]|jgi:hypothetical protein